MKMTDPAASAILPSSSAPSTSTPSSLAVGVTLDATME